MISESYEEFGNYLILAFLQVIMPSPNNTPSLENPTWDFLYTNFRKIDLQKHCREIGIKRVYVTKDKLVDMIIEKHRNSRPIVSETDVPEHDITPRDAMAGVEELRERINVRDVEIEELNELLKNAHVTINKLNDRLSSLEEQVNQLQETTAQQQQILPILQDPSSTPKGTLLLGDNNLVPVRASDLNKQCSVRTIREANIDLVKCWVSEKLQWVPKCCILYCGIQDILDGSIPAEIFDKLGSLVANLKQVNEDMNIYVCELVPILKVQEYDEKINNFNNQLAEWSVQNGVTVIKTNLQFRLGTGEVDQLCFNVDHNESQGNFLNRFGIIRLLNVISKQCPLFELHTNWENIANQVTPTHTLPSFSWQGFTRNERSHQSTVYTGRGNYQDNQTYSEESRASGLNNRDLGYQHDLQNDSDNLRRPIPRRREADERRYSQYSSGGDYRSQHALSTRGWERNSTAAPRNRFNGHPQSRPYHHQQEDRPRRQPCYNCGESNHDFSECRFDHRIRCDRCGSFGHKPRLCRE